MNAYPIRSLNTNDVLIEGSFAPAGAGTPTAVKGRGYTVVRTSQGLYTITLADKFVELQCGKVSLQLAAAAARSVQIGAVDVSSAQTVQVRVIDGAGAVQDVAADANNRVHFSLTLTQRSNT